MMLSGAPTAGRNRLALRLQYRRSKPQAQQNEHQAGKSAAHIDVDCTTSHSPVMSHGAEAVILLAHKF